MFSTGSAIIYVPKFDVRSHYVVHTSSMQSMLKLGGSGACPQENFENCMLAWRLILVAFNIQEKVKLVPIFFLILGKVDICLI